ncbi:hypothetical protein TRIUR3_11723 [Triticum urartu]|uniref:Uncharacterized protein n=1 Tax=Triticum urartu TaxID=4572 RepID=M7Y691_TRIUA|nr:hypothetical protein TRIUR3_11723 [Triticum urartu]
MSASQRHGGRLHGAQTSCSPSSTSSRRRDAAQDGDPEPVVAHRSSTSSSQRREQQRHGATTCYTRRTTREKTKRRCAPGDSIGKIGTKMAASWERRADGGGAYGGSLATVMKFRLQRTDCDERGHGEQVHREGDIGVQVLHHALGAVAVPGFKPCDVKLY